MTGYTSIEPSLARSIIDQIDLIVQEAERTKRPLEIDPFRSRLFELFVMADAADLLKEAEKGDASAGVDAVEGDSPRNEPLGADLTADNLCRALAERWNLGDAARESFTNQTRLPAAHLARMRLLWSVMRMWMEWTYAWQRWHEFHPSGHGPRPPAQGP